MTGRAWIAALAMMAIAAGGFATTIEPAGAQSTLQAALWLKDDLARRGHDLNEGDPPSLGSLTAPIPLAGLSRVTSRLRRPRAQGAQHS